MRDRQAWNANPRHRELLFPQVVANHKTLKALANYVRFAPGCDTQLEIERRYRSIVQTVQRSSGQEMECRCGYSDLAGRRAREQPDIPHNHSEERNRENGRRRTRAPGWVRFEFFLQKFIPAIRTGSTRDSRSGNATATRNAPF